MIYTPLSLSADGQLPEAAAEPEPAVEQGAGHLSTTMVLRGAVGTLIGAAVAPKGSEGLWGAAGFVVGATLGEVGIVGLAFAALWRKAE
jgi:hypothetical protein